MAECKGGLFQRLKHVCCVAYVRTTNVAENEAMGTNRFKSADRHGATLSMLALVLCGLTACAQAVPPETAAATKLDPRWQAIEREVDDAPCDSDQQCRTLPIGNKACDGPERWLVWSTKTTGEAALRQLLDAQSTIAVHAPSRPVGHSDCSLVPDPGAVCRAGHCVLLLGPAAAR